MKRFDVFGMCNALFDLQAEVSDELLGKVGLGKGGMTLLSDDEQKAIVPQVYRHIVNTESGGSGANTMIGVAQLGGKTAFTSRVGKDEHGRAYRAGLAAQGVYPNLGEGETGETGVCLILITPDAQRTMGTYLGLSQGLEASDVDTGAVADSQYLYVTGYLWDTDNQKEAVRHAMKTAKEAGVMVAFSLSDPFCVYRHKADFLMLLQDYVDVVFANREEALAITDETEVETAALALATLTGGLAAVTSDKDGSLLVRGDSVLRVPVYPVTALDTTGAGDMYAAGILYGLTSGLPLVKTGQIASYVAAQVVARIGPRLPEINRAAIEGILRG